MSEELHIPVLYQEVLEMLAPKQGESYIDLTAGYGGHASKILAVTQNYKDATLVDRDEFAIDFLREKFAKEIASQGLKLVKNDFYNAVLREIECGKKYDMVLADFGVSSVQLDWAERGFSFQNDGPLDMRMDKSQNLTAEKVVNGYSERELVEIFVKYGEEKNGFAKLIAREIVHNRPFYSTKQLAELIKSKSRFTKTHPATRIFQAIRIEVNDELGEIERTLPLIPKIMNQSGRVAIITFHSLEDRLVKQSFREMSGYGEESELKILNKEPILAKEMELITNPRARSAKLRTAERI